MEKFSFRFSADLRETLEKTLAEWNGRHFPARLTLSDLVRLSVRETADRVSGPSGDKLLSRFHKRVEGERPRAEEG